MSLFGKLTGSELQRANRYAKLAEASPIRSKANISRYLYWDGAVKHMRNYCGSAEGKIDDDKYVLLKRRLLEFERKKEIESRRLEEYFGRSVESLIPDRIKHLKRTVIVLGTTVAVGTTIGAYEFFNNLYDTYMRNQKVAKEYIPELERSLKSDDVDLSKKLLTKLVVEKNRLPFDSYRDVWDKVDGLSKEVENSERFVRAKKKFEDAVKAAKEGRYAVALDLVEGRSGINVLLGALGEENLPSYLRDEVAKFSAEITEFSETYSTRKSSFNVFNPIKEDVNKLETKVNELSENFKKGEVPQRDKLDNLLMSINQYLNDLDHKVRTEDVGSSDFDKVKGKLFELRELVSGRSGLLTTYETIELNRLKSSLENVKNKLNILEVAGYLESDPETVKLMDYMNAIRNNLRKIDANRVETFDFVWDLNDVSKKLNEAYKQLDIISKLKEGTNDSKLEVKLKAADELVRRYFDRDYKTKKWDKVLEYLNLIPEPRVGNTEKISEIINLESKIAKQEGQIFVTASGLTNSDLVDYKIQTDIYQDKKDEQLIIHALKSILKKTDLEEGKTLLSEIEDVAKLRNEKSKLETIKLDDATKNKVEEIKLKISETETKINDDLSKFGETVKSFLEKGDKIPDLKLLEFLSTLYHELGKSETSTEYDNRLKELKKKYNLE